jgi:drug/metabolite transporter (DMT)-like permease
MEAGMSSLLGSSFVLIFTLSQAFRDVYFGDVFQRYNYFVVLLIAFSLSTVIFASSALVRAPGDFGKLHGQMRAIVSANITTALAWTCFFFALTYLDPAIVNTIHSAMGPLTVVVLGACGVALAKPKPISRIEYAGYAGIAASVVALWWVVIGGYSGLPTTNFRVSITGLALLGVSGASITVSLLYCKRLQDRGVGADAITAVRYIVLIALAGSVVLWRGKTGIAAPRELGILAAATTALIVLPLFAFQLGIGRTAPLTAQVIRALGPAFVFALEQFDGRVRYSTPTLVCILLYSASVILSNLAHGWSDERKRDQAAVRSAPSPAQAR